MLCEQHKPTTSGAWEKMQELHWFHPLRDLYVSEDSCAHDSDDSVRNFFHIGSPKEEEEHLFSVN